MPPKRKKTDFAEAEQSKKIQPYNPEAEAAVLGAILIDPERTLDLCSNEEISEDSFYIHAHKTIFNVARDLYNKGLTVDPVSISDELQRTGKLDEIGGIATLERLAERTMSVAYAAHYVEILHDNELLRRIIDVAISAETKCYSRDRSTDLILSETEQAVLSISENQKIKAPTWSESVATTFEHLNILMAHTDGLNGLSTGLTDLDNRMQGLRPAEMIVLAARPSMGKTSLAMNICENVAAGRTTDGTHTEPNPVLIFSCEMSTEALITRMLCSYASVPAVSIMKGTGDKQVMTQRLMRAADDLSKLPIYVDDTGGLDVMDLRARARRMHKRYGIKLIMIDYLQLLNSKAYSNQGRQLETSHISSQVKAMAKELNVPVIVLSQLSRSPEQRDKSGKPKLSDLRDSGAIEQDADVVMMLRRPCKYEGAEHSDDKTLAIVDVAKNRNGPTGEVELNFEDSFTRFSNRVFGTRSDEPFNPNTSIEDQQG